MNNVQALHNNAMDLAEEAAVEQRHGNLEKAEKLFRDAYLNESKAAAALASHHEMEPTRSVLFRSAASLALDCREHRAAEKLIAQALSGDPPAEIAAELRDLLEQVYFQRHLDLQGIVLEQQEFQMSISGNAVGHGFAESEMFINRVQDLQRMIYRTGERKLQHPFRDRGRSTVRLAEAVGIYISVPRAASFAVTFRLGRSKQMSLPGMDFGNVVIQDLMDCIEIIGSGSLMQLEQRIPDAAYRRNFSALAKRIAPDGEAVRVIGFTAGGVGEERRVLLTRTQSEIQQPEIAPVSAEQGERITLTGRLKYADSTKEDINRIKIVDKKGKLHSISVPQGMMDDIVRPLWDFDVTAYGIKGRSILYLETIDKSGENEMS
jgi:hypothetical protein